ncbi:hypothetical protein [Natranaerobius trueperi]|uniref:hypothetical protein n=1 Tax=Natranaerobius trueperi TaxID=759412 RepID=UPI00197BDA60|nr:hypothetical protein [Natranaerobius trueperi]
MNTKIKLGNHVVISAWLAIFVLFSYRATFSVLLEPMEHSTGWSAGELSLGYSLMMSIYAITAFLSGFIIDRGGLNQRILLVPFLLH